MPNANRPDAQKFLTDPEFQSDRDIFFACVDARLKQHAEEAKKPDSPSRGLIASLFAPFADSSEDGPFSFFDNIFGGRK